MNEQAFEIVMSFASLPTRTEAADPFMSLWM